MPRFEVVAGHGDHEVSARFESIQPPQNLVIDIETGTGHGASITMRDKRGRGPATAH